LGLPRAPVEICKGAYSSIALMASTTQNDNMGVLRQNSCHIIQPMDKVRFAPTLEAPVVK